MPERPLQPDAAELILCKDDRYVCETYIFEPSPGEEQLGFLFAAGEAEARDGVGAELLDTVVTAIQKEYFREPQRNPSTSFEMALHQANLILHDAAEAGVRDWMGYFHMAIGVLIDSQLHISVAGGGKVLLARKSQLTNISSGLAHFPITNALQTFSQLATGQVESRDTLFFTTAHFDTLFRPVDVTRFTLDHSAATITSRLQQLYSDQQQHTPLAFVTASLLPQYVAAGSGTAKAGGAAVSTRASSGVAQANIRPRAPLVIHRSSIQRIFLFIAQIFVTFGRLIRQYIWPVVKQGSQKGGQMVWHASKQTGQQVYGLASRRNASSDTTSQQQSRPTRSWRGLPGVLLGGLLSIPARTTELFRSLPRTSKIFGVVSIVLLIALGVSLLLLQQKRVTDTEIARASELLHEARTKKDAAETALIYDNRDQAKGFLSEASTLVAQLAETGLYAEETASLRQDITTQTDRLQRVTRITPDKLKLIGDVAPLMNDEEPNHLFFVNDSIYTYNPENNAVVRVGLDGSTETVREDTQGVGFIENGATHSSDKTITFSTNPAGVALFDTKDNTLTAQEITLGSPSAKISALAVFGNRLYTYEAGAQNIMVYNKTLRGYSSGSPWIEDDSFPKDSIRSLAVDGNIYTLHHDGSVRALFKGAAADFVQEKVEPALSSAATITTTDTLQYLYIVDPSNKRVIIYTKKGALVKQLFIETTATELTDVAIDPSETKLYALDGTRILEVPLEE